MNLISVSKMGKSWLTYTLALSVITGSDWFGTFACTPGSVLILDGELPRKLWPIDSQLLPRQWASRQDGEEFIEVLPLRGLGYDLLSIGSLISELKPDYYSLVILDAWIGFCQRAFPKTRTQKS